MTEKPDRDIEKDYPVSDFVAKLRRLADALEAGEQFEITANAHSGLNRQCASSCARPVFR